MPWRIRFQCQGVFLFLTPCVPAGIELYVQAGTRYEILLRATAHFCELFSVSLVIPHLLPQPSTQGKSLTQTHTHVRTELLVPGRSSSRVAQASLPCQAPIQPICSCVHLGSKWPRVNPSPVLVISGLTPEK